jgi:hypothetical protein
MQKLEMEEHIRAALRESADFRDPARPEGLTPRALDISDILMADVVQFAEEYRSQAAGNVVPVNDDPDHEMPSLQPHEGLIGNGDAFTMTHEEVIEDAATPESGEEPTPERIYYPPDGPFSG